MRKEIKFIWTSGYISRSTLRSHRDTVYLFGDNLLERGFGGMASEMRGEPNAVGIPTKKAPSMVESSFFSDRPSDKAIAVPAISRSVLKALEMAKAEGMNGTIIVPSSIGAGLSKMPEKCPLVYNYMCKILGKL